ncbi:MAG: serine/threonine-protein phosphatase [Spirochaetes bacterium]|nr:serine/threonine-protein phosphatase [Spirochaetota bacterium]
MKTLYKRIFAFTTRYAGYGSAVMVFSVLWSGLITEINLIYLVPIMSLFFDFSPQWFSVLKVLFILPYPSALFFYGAFTRLGIPALFPSFRTVNRDIVADGGAVGVRKGLSLDGSRALLKAVDRMPVIFFFVAVFEVAYIDIIVLAYAIINGYSAATIGLICFSWFAQTALYAGIGYILAETVTGGMRRECKKALRAFSREHELPGGASVKHKLAIVVCLLVSVVTISILMTYLRRDALAGLLVYLAVFFGVISVLIYITLRGFYRSLYDAGQVVESLKNRGEGIIYTPTMDREMVAMAAGINAAADTISDYRVNLEEKVEDRTRELQAAMEEMEAINENLVRVNGEIEASNRRYLRDMEMARNVQAAFLPAAPPAVDGFDIAFVYRPMSGVSGDLYDFYQENGSIAGAGIFDVSGHGISSGLLTLLARSIIYRKFTGMEDAPLGEVMTGINAALIEEIGQSGFYLSGVLLRFRDDLVEYVNAAHPPMVCRSGKSGRVMKAVRPGGQAATGPLLGVSMMNERYGSLSMRIGEGDAMLLYTDSLYETQNAAGEPYEFDRIMDSFAGAPDGTAREMLDHVMDEFYGFTGKKDAMQDDITVMVVKRKQNAPGGRTDEIAGR